MFLWYNLEKKIKKIAENVKHVVICALNFDGVT